ncbi:MAG: hypothetical protein U0132_11320 [Gemmatimonadaceae bacterium]
MPWISVGAQRARGPGEDATVLRAGQLRVGVRSDWSFANERFGRDGTPTAGQPEPLGTDFSGSMGSSMFEHLIPLRTELQSILSTPVDALSAGTLRTTMDLGVYTTPFSIDLGLTNRLMLSVLVPYVKTLNDLTIYPNVPVASANVGLNPGAVTAATMAVNAQVVAQLNTAAGRLSSELTRCSGLTDASCSAINADRTGAAALVTLAGRVASSVGKIYGTPTVRGNAFAPLGNSALQASVLQLLTGIATDFTTFLGAPTGQTTWVDARPVGSALMAFNDLQTVLADSALGIAAVPLESVRRSHLGDITVGAKFLLLDTTHPARAVAPSDDRPGIRVAVSGAYRLPGAQQDAPDNFADVGTGDRSPDIEGAAYVDAMFSKRLWASVVARYALQQADRLPIRVATPGTPFPALYRQQDVSRDLGDILSIDVFPRFSPNEILTFAGWYRFATKSADAYAGTFSITDLAGATQSIDASILNTNSAQREQRVGGGITYSTLASWQRGQARWPLEVTVTRQQTIAGTNALVKATTTSFGLRYYARVFGAPLRPPPARKATTQPAKPATR